MADIQRNRHAPQDLVGLAQDIGRVLVFKQIVGWKHCALTALLGSALAFHFRPRSLWQLS